MRLVAAAIAIGLLVFSGSAVAQCDYRFSGQFQVQRNGVELPLSGVKVRVKRENGTGLGRRTVVTDEDGRFEGTWSFDRDQNGVLPGSNDINLPFRSNCMTKAG